MSENKIQKLKTYILTLMPIGYFTSKINLKK